MALSPYGGGCRFAVAAFVAIGLVLPAAAVARVPIRVGIGDQQVAMFANPAFQRAKIKRVRYVIAWNAMDSPAQRREARAYVARARRSGISVILHLATDDYVAKKAKLPSVSSYRSHVRRLVKYFRGLGVREFGVFDEANHASEPTYKSPNHAALFFEDMYRAVKVRCRTCAVVALDVLDQPGVQRYIDRFFKRLSPTWRRRASVIGLHNYGDVNRRRTTYTRAMIQHVHRYNRKAKLWLTETGAIVVFGRSFPYSPARAALRIATMFSIANRYRRSGIKRLYVFQWTGAPRGARFDAGLTNSDGTPRPAYAVLRKKLGGYLR
jgi:hypothetical protein